MSLLTIAELMKAKKLIDSNYTLPVQFDMPPFSMRPPEPPEPEASFTRVKLTYGVKLVGPQNGYLIKDAVVESHQDWVNRMVLKIVKTNPYPYRSKKKRFKKKWRKFLIQKAREILS